MKFPPVTEDGKIVCQLCGKPFDLITPSHLKRSHDTTYEKYRDLFPGAPLTSKQYQTMRKYVTFKTFKDKPETLSDDVPVPSPVKRYSPDPIPEPEEDYGPHVHPNKAEILKFLQSIYPALINNYTIELKAPSGHLEFQFCTDMADPISKTDFEFPNAIWHNKDCRPNSAREVVMKKEGWGVIRINTTVPTIEDVQEYLDIVVED